jgi:hypothetical protein
LREEERRRGGDGERREERGVRREKTNLAPAARLGCGASPSGSIASIQSIPSM